MCGAGAGALEDAELQRVIGAGLAGREDVAEAARVVRAVRLHDIGPGSGRGDPGDRHDQRYRRTPHPRREEYRKTGRGCAGAF
ncbi:MAG: hypothetical protein E6G29_08690 [Actinobacteria bacterium]|nr:MAG: hypothetical protein E6G29_08690 [Actinomycetota bacterium]